MRTDSRINRIGMDFGHIEAEVSKIHKQIWTRRQILWPAGHPSDIDMLDPEMVSTRILGVEFLVEERINGHFSRDRVEIAGLIDRQKNRIVVSRKFPPEQIHFTAAHELGHWILHPNEIMHRDRPIGFAPQEPKNLPPAEREANYFAVQFLMPRKLIEKEFKSRFPVGLNGALKIDENSAFHLCPSDTDSVLYPHNGIVDQAILLSSARRFGSNRFNSSIAEAFHVSPSAMAYRLIELNLIVQ